MKIDEAFFYLPSVSGDEKEVRDYLKSWYTSRSQEVLQDRLGSIFAKKTGQSPYTIMISSNLDEQGGVVSDIDEKGLLHFVVVGTLDKKDFLHQDVWVLDRRHRKVYGTVVFVCNQVVIDVGARTRQQALEMGVQVGDVVSRIHEIHQLNEHVVMGTHLQNKIGLVFGMQLLERLQAYEGHPSICIGGIAHSVTGQRGAITATTLIKPDVAIVVEATPVCHYKENSCYIRYFDKSLLPNIQLLEHLKKTASEIGIEMIHQVHQKATDGAFIHKSLIGTPTVVVEIPLKHEGPFSNMVDLRDVENLLTVLIHYIQTVTDEDIRRYHFETVG